MSRPLTMSQLLKRAGLAKRPRPGRMDATPSFSKRPRSGQSMANGSREDQSEAEENREHRSGNGAPAEGGAVDDQIEALERELKGGGDSSSSSSSGSDDDDNSSDDDTETRLADLGGRVDKLVSPLETEKIDPLPAHLLPRPGCGVHKDNKKKQPKKTGPKVNGTKAGAPGQSRGLDSAVKELLANYEARSSERVPFYCRVCKFQGDSLEALERHKEEPLHVEATKKERKISTCSLCKKQFTSPPQLKEHLAGKAHLERLQAIMLRQGKWVPGGRGRGAGSELALESEGWNGYSGRGNDAHRGWAAGRGGGRGGRDGGGGRGGRIGRGRGASRGYEREQ